MKQRQRKERSDFQSPLQKGLSNKREILKSLRRYLIKAINKDKFKQNFSRNIINFIENFLVYPKYCLGCHH